MDTGIAVNPNAKNNQFCSTITNPNAMLDKERTHNFTQANTQIVFCQINRLYLTKHFFHAFNPKAKDHPQIFNRLQEMI